MVTGWKRESEEDTSVQLWWRSHLHTWSVHQVSSHIPLDPVWLSDCFSPPSSPPRNFLVFKQGSAHPVLTLTWQESFPPSLKPAQIMLLVIEPYEALHLVLDTMGTLTSCSVWGKGRETARGKKSVVNIDSGRQATVSCFLPHSQVPNVCESAAKNNAQNEWKRRVGGEKGKSFAVGCSRWNGVDNLSRAVYPVISFINQGHLLKIRQPAGSWSDAQPS